MKMRDRFFKKMGKAEEGLQEYAEEGREELAQRAAELRAQFAENVTQQAVTSFAGWTLVSTGIAWGVTDVMKGRLTFRSLVAPIALLAFGAAVLGGGSMWQRRSAHISEAESRVREEMYALDPFARFRVLRDVGGETVPFVKRISLRN